MSTQTRLEHEAAHGRVLADGEPERIWGWASPAGRRRARRRADLIATAGDLGPGRRVLEVGCGTGMFTEMWASSGAEILAVDLASELIERARARQIGGQVRFAAKPFKKCDSEGPFDAIVGSSILHHLEIRPALRRLHQLLKPGGRMAFAEPNMLNPQVCLTKNVPWTKKAMGDSPDETAFVGLQLKSLLRKAGFRQIEVSAFDFLHPSTPLVLIEAVSRVGRVLERVPGIRSIAGSLIISAVRE